MSKGPIAVIDAQGEGAGLITYKRAVRQIHDGSAEWERAGDVIRLRPRPAKDPVEIAPPEPAREPEQQDAPPWMACWRTAEAAVAWPWLDEIGAELR